MHDLFTGLRSSPNFLLTAFGGLFEEITFIYFVLFSVFRLSVTILRKRRAWFQVGVHAFIPNESGMSSIVDSEKRLICLYYNRGATRFGAHDTSAGQKVVGVHP